MQDNEITDGGTGNPTEKSDEVQVPPVPAGAEVRKEPKTGSRPLFVEADPPEEGPQWVAVTVTRDGKPVEVVLAETREAAEHWDERLWQPGRPR